MTDFLHTRDHGSEEAYMARIRSIHPTTLTDPEFAAIPIPGRLLFIYSWTIADDAGNLERSPRGMKMAMFPGDESMTVKRITKLTEELIAGRFYEPYEVGGKAYLHIRSFRKYQKPDHPTPPRFPLYPGHEYVYHVKQGNTWTTRKETGGFVERTGNGQRLDSEPTGDIPAGEELELESKGKELDLESRGKEWMGKKRGEGLALPSPPSRGGGAAAFWDKCNSGAIIENRNQQAMGFDSGNSKLDWRIAGNYLREQIDAGKLNQSQARNGLLVAGASVSLVNELFPEEVTSIRPKPLCE